MTSAGHKGLAVDANGCLDEGRRQELRGEAAEAMDSYAAAIEFARGDPGARTRSDALRRLGVLHHHRGESELARELCERSYETAQRAKADDLAAESLNALAGFDFEHGLLDEASGRYSLALKLAGETQSLTAKILQNRGILASVRGDWSAAADDYARALAIFEQEHDQRGSAFAHHNLGRLHADQHHWAEAENYFRASQQLAEAIGDRHLAALASLNRAEAQVGLAQYDLAHQSADRALEAFAALDARRDRAAAYRILGTIFRETNRPTLAESHLRSAFEIARAADCPLLEADALREMAKLYGGTGRTTDAARCLLEARELYYRLGAKPAFDETVIEQEALALHSPASQPASGAGQA